MTDVALGSISDEQAVAYRAQFPIFDHTIYLNSCSLGPLSRDALDALAAYQEAWSRFGAPAWWKHWLNKIEEAREGFARLVHAEPDEVTVSHSVSSALASVASTFDYGERDEVVCSDLEFPTIPYQWLAKQRQGVNVRFARSDDKIRIPLEKYDQLIGRRTAVVATSHTFYSTGYIQPIRSLADLAHERGAAIVVDGYHAVGVHPVDVKALDVDVYIGGTLKWLLGGPGLTFIYVRGDLLSTMNPSITGWFSSRNQFAFDNQRLEWPESANRLELGTPAVATAYSGVAGMNIIASARIERIYARIQHLTDRVVRQAQRTGYRVASPEDPEDRGGIVMLEVQRPEETVQALAERNITVDYRPGLVRVAPHFFNTDEDVDRLMDELRDVQKRLR